jgi:hypothetical protein
MVGASDVDSSSAYSTSSSSGGEDEGARLKGRKPSKNLSGLSCFARDGFCTMVLMLMVYFGTPNMFITLLFGFDYGTNPPLGALII